MKRTKLIQLSLVAGLGLCLTAPVWAGEQRVFSTRTLRDSLSAGATPCRLIVDNVWGDVRVQGRAGAAVAVEAVETVHAESADAAERARSEVELDLAVRGGVFEIVVDGPFRDRDDRRRWARHHRDPGYTVVYDIDVQAPRDCDLDVRTVNDGEVTVADVAGSLTVHNVNGGIRLDRVSGTGGEIATVNGPIHGSFLRGPSEALSFRSVNGRIEVSFPPRLAADLTLESTWGEMWSEFDLTPLPAGPPKRRNRDGRLVIEAGHAASLRAGAGGPQIRFETLNGDILIRKGG